MECPLLGRTGVRVSPLTLGGGDYGEVMKFSLFE
jgi:hypothetical protein